MAKEYGGIQSLYKDCIVPAPGPRETPNATIVDGVEIRDGQKGTPGIMAEVGGMSLPDDTGVGTGLTGIKGSEPRS